MSQAFFLPTRVFAGAGCVGGQPQAWKALGRRVLVVTGRSSARLSGALADLEATLSGLGVDFAVFDEVPPNPGFVDVRAGAAAARAWGADAIVGIGGGSPLDAAKAIAVLATNDLDDDALLVPPFPHDPLPIAAIPTTAGTGSEVTPYAILTNDKIQSKSNLSHESLFPKLAFLDPKYTTGLPRTVTVNTALDALSHLVEGYLAVRSTTLSQNLALQGLATLGPSLRALATSEAEPSPALREALLLGSCTAGMVIAHTGTTVGHALGYSLTYFKNIDHGRANALVMAACLNFLAPHHPDRVRRVLEALHCTSVSELSSLLDALLGPKESLSADEVARFASIAVKARNLANTLKAPTEAECAALYRSSLAG